MAAKRAAAVQYAALPCLVVRSVVSSTTRHGNHLGESGFADSVAASSRFPVRPSLGPHLLAACMPCGLFDSKRDMSKRGPFAPRPRGWAGQKARGQSHLEKRGAQRSRPTEPLRSRALAQTPSFSPSIIRATTTRPPPHTHAVRAHTLHGGNGRSVPQLSSGAVQWQGRAWHLQPWLTS